MTFEDEIKPVHWQDMLAQMAEWKFRWVVRAGILVSSFLAATMVLTMGLFGYAVALAFSKKGLAGMLAEPWIPIYVVIGLVTTVLAVFYLVYDKRLLQLLWGLRNGQQVEPGMLREGVTIGPVAVTLGDESVEIRMPHDTDRVKWRAFTALHETAETFMLMFSPHLGLVVPKASLTATGRVDEARSFMAARIGAGS